MFRWFALAILLGAVGTSGYYRWRARLGSETIARSRESGFFMAIRALVALLLYLPVIAYATIPQWMTWASFALPAWIRWIGVIAGLLTIPAVPWVLGSLGHNVSEAVLTKRDHQLVTAGPYRWVRHPLYTTGITLFVALGLMEASWFVLCVTAVAALFIQLLVIPAEERALVEKFGDQYRSYMGRTGRLSPSMKVTYFRFVSGSQAQSALAALLLLILAAELGFTARRESQTVDEGIHIYAGYRHWCGDYGINPEHPPLAKLVATIPLLFDHPKNSSPACGSDNSDKSGYFAMGRQFLYSNDADRILTETRSFIGLFPLLLAILVFVATRRMFGGWTGLLAMLLVVFEPTIVGHGTLVTTDLAETCCYFAAVYAFYRYTQQRTNLHLIVAGVAAGLALAAKHSGILLLPALVLLATADLWLRRREARDEMSGRESELKMRLVRQAVALAVIFIIAFVTLWGFYRFRHAPRPSGYEMSESLSAFIEDGVQYRHAHGLMLTRVIPLLAYVLPKSYVYGMADIAIDNSVGRTAYVFGQLYTTGKWFYFPAAILVKATLGFLPLLLLTIPAAGYLWREKKRETLFLLIPAIFFLAVSMTSKLNFGIRHVLAIFPLLIVLAAGAACYLANRNRVWLYAVVLFAAFHCASSLRAFPYYLSYSNEAFGGPQQTYRYLLDTNSDWAQGLIDDRDYLARNLITDCWIDYYGPLDPDYYGVLCNVLALYPSKRAGALPLPFEGTLIVSVADYMGYSWGPPEIDPFGPLHHVQPVARLGGHSLVFQGHFDLPVPSAESHSAMAQLLAGQGRIVEALTEARTGVALAPQAMDTHLSLAQILVQAKQLSAARAEYLESIRLAEAQGEGYWWASIGPARQGLAQLNAAH